jgi:nucleoside-diphosphate-sugar epimerase
MNQSSKTVLITGANGFVGARLCRKFLDEGFQVVAGVRRTGDLSLLSGMQLSLAYGDITEPESLPEMASGVNYVVHNAGLVKARTRERFFKVNVEGTGNLFETIADFNPFIKRVVYVSSTAASGPVRDKRPVLESDPPRPMTAYGESKVAGEEVALSYRDRFNVVVVRPTGVYGPGDKEILSFFKSVNRGIRPEIGDTNRLIHLIHVDDVCEAVYKAAMAEVASGSIYHIAEKKAYRMCQLLDLLTAASGRKTHTLKLSANMFRKIAALSEWFMKLFGKTPMLTREKAEELLASWEFSTDKAKDELGFESAVGFDIGAKDTLAWYRKEGWL